MIREACIQSLPEAVRAASRDAGIGADQRTDSQTQPPHLVQPAANRDAGIGADQRTDSQTPSPHSAHAQSASNPAARSAHSGVAADRLELCVDLSVGGLTPPPALVRSVVGVVQIPVMCMIRPRAGGFVYTEDEITEMCTAIALAAAAGAAGVVFGALTERGEVDRTAMRALLSEVLKHPGLSVTFHKAIDETPDPVAALSVIRSLGGVNRILTSGGRVTAEEGIPILRRMVAEAGDDIIILVAGKVTPSNIHLLAQETGATEFHGRRIAGDLTL